MTGAGDRIRSIPLFAGFSEGDLDRIAGASAERRLEAGQQLFAEGDEGADAFAVVAGELEILKRSGRREVLLAVRGPGEVVGEMALLEDRPRAATVRARSAVVLLQVPKAVLDEVITTSAVASRALSGTLLSRWRETEARLRQREQMAQLGTLAAGMAHELNNPAAAARAAAAGFLPAAERLAEATAALGGLELSEEARDLALRLGVAGLRRLSAGERVSREEQLAARLRSLGVERPRTRAGALAGLDPEVVDEVLDRLTARGQGAASEAVLAAALARGEVAGLAATAADALGRISEIVGAVKSYSFTGRGPLQDVDLAAMLDDTLTLMAHRLKGIEVVRDYREVPRFPAYGGELNQVWTNLIDNAADAIRAAGRDPGRITVCTHVEGGDAVVEVEDDGTGIPADIVPRVFDAFFTTKPPGSGTGLGLEISYGIIVQHHGGDISVDTEPGRTRFVVRLPLAGPG